MLSVLLLLSSIAWLIQLRTVDTHPLPPQQCPDYSSFSQQRHPDNLSAGIHQLPYQRPAEECRTFRSQEVEDTITRLRTKMKDPDLFRLFENTYPNTLDTAVKWKGFALADDGGSYTDEDLAFIITGDINAMWLRDSANQILSYLPLLRPSSSSESLASLFRGVINLHSRYIKISPYCHAFQPPPESSIPTQKNYAFHLNKVDPPYNPQLTFDCKWELDSLASFLHLSSAYYNATGDIVPFSKYQWLETVESILSAVEAMRTGTYTPDGHIGSSGYTMTGQTTRGSETTWNNGLGNPVASHTGLIRSTFRPSDDATIFQFLIPANMFFAASLSSAAGILDAIPPTERTSALALSMRTMASEIRQGVDNHGVTSHPLFGLMYAYETDGYGSHSLMDDANTPSLLSIPLFGYTDVNHAVYRNTRRFVLSESNPYWMFGEVLSAVGGPHVGPGRAWPLASIIQGLTSDDDGEIRGVVGALLGSTDGLGLIHESVNSWDVHDWSRQWFAWANGMFGNLILELEASRPYLLGERY